MSDSAASLLEAVLNGDVSKVEELLRAAGYDRRSQSLLDEAARSPTHVLQRAAVVQVLLEWGRGAWPDEKVQRWAETVRKYFPDEDDDALVTAVMRLDELGDLIDGTIDPSERAALIDSLR